MNQSDVVTRPSVGQLWALALPIVISRSAQVVVGITDAVMVGALGETALAATTTAGMNTFNILVFPMGVVFVVQSFAAQLHGKGDGHGARRYGWYGLGIAAVAQLLCFAAMPFVDDAVALLPYEGEVRTLMVTYLVARLTTGGAAVGLEALGAWYGGLGNTRLPMLAQVLAMVLNVGLNWLLITGNLGAPALGVQGAAIASAASTLVAWMVLTACFVTGVGVARPVGAGAPLAMREALRLLRFGVPSGLNWFIEFLAFSFFINAVLPLLGTQTVAALMSVFQLNSVAFMPAFALASAGAIFVGQAIGADRRDDVSRTVVLTMSAAAAWMGFVALVYVSAPQSFLSPFVADDASPAVRDAFLELGSRMLMLSCLWQLFDAAAMVLSESLRAAGDTSFPFWTRCVVAWCVFVPGVWFTVHRAGGDEVAAVLWLAAYLGLLAAALVWRFRTGRWRYITLTEESLVEASSASPSSPSQSTSAEPEQQ
jgi:multidrug resistance protein, MATE family